MSSYNAAVLETKALQDEYEKRRQIILESAQGTGEQRQALVDSLEQQYLAARETYITQEAETFRAGVTAIVSSFTTSMNDMANAMASMGTEGTGAYKALVATVQMASAAMALINAHLAFTQALSDPTLPWYAKVAAGLAVLSAGLNAVASIRNAVASFEGGGQTPDGNRTGGVDGHGGMLAVLHPNEKVTDLTQEDKAAAVNVSVQVSNNFSDADIKTTTRNVNGQQVIQIAVSQAERVKNEILADIAGGNGQFSSALRQQYSRP
jgi:hypothetical protein